jgi:pyruvate kinase
MIDLVRNKKNFSKNLKTKIVATLGPSSQDEKTLRAMINRGMSVARLNFSHGSHETHLEVINRIRKISESEKKPVAILQDLAGPKIRLDYMPKPVYLKKNTNIRLSVARDQEADLFTNFRDLPQYIRPGDTILLDDGNVELKTIGVETNSINCKVIVPGIASSRKGINLPDISVPIPVFQPKDKQDLAFGLSQPIDMVAMSFVESAQDAYPLRVMIEKMSKNLPIIAKIERPKALNNLNKILDAFDGIMIARGDLGVEISPEEVPVIQKKLIKAANLKSKIVITATQMLESMIQNPRPTRAEASDVSNAILDGTDAVMLSGETAIGKHPVKSVSMMKRIALATENSKLYHYSVNLEKEKIDNTEAIVKSATMIAQDLKAKAILVFTQSGNTALLISKYRPDCPILAFSPYKNVVLNMASYWGVLPHWLKFTPNTDNMIHLGELHVKEEHLVKSGDLVVTIAGITPMKGATNMLRVSRIS